MGAERYAIARHVFIKRLTMIERLRIGPADEGVRVNIIFFDVEFVQIFNPNSRKEFWLIRHWLGRAIKPLDQLLRVRFIPAQPDQKAMLAELGQNGGRVHQGLGRSTRKLTHRCRR